MYIKVGDIKCLLVMKWYEIYNQMRVYKLSIVDPIIIAYA